MALSTRSNSLVNSRRVAVLLASTAFLATPAFSQALSVPAGTTYTLTANESYDTISGAGTVKLTNNYLTLGADGSSSTFNGNINDLSSQFLQFVGSWAVDSGPYWYNTPVLSGTEAAALLFGGVASDYRVSTVDNQVANINDMAWYDQYAIGGTQASSTYHNDPNGTGIYDQTGDNSAYVSDRGVAGVNYAFGAGNADGGLTKVGSGTVSLLGSGNWTGLTTIDGGTLLGTSDSISGGSIVDNATLSYVQPTSGTVAQDISGTGNVNVSGLGAGQSLTFSGALTNDGGLTLGTDANVVIDGSVSSASTNGAIQVLGDNDTITVTAGHSVTSTQTSGGNNASAIYGTGANFTVTNAGTISAPGDLGATFGSNGIYATNGVTVNNTGNIYGLPQGSASTYRSDGVITFGTSIVNNTGATVSGGALVGAVAGGGVITGGWEGAYLTDDGTVYNSGTIAANVYAGVDIQGVGALSNYSGGQIVGVSNGAHIGLDATVYNNGLIAAGSYDSASQTITAGATGNGLFLSSGGTVVNDAGGRIVGGTSANGGDNGLLSFGALTLTNSGAITGGDYGVSANAGGSLTNLSGGTISGGSAGLQLDGDNLVVNNFAGGQIIGSGNGAVGVRYGVGNNVTIDNAGQIVGQFAGVTSNGAIDLTNSGLIGSGSLSGTTFSYSNGNDGIQILGGGSVDNLAGGQILGSISGIYAANTPFTVDNAGTIHGNQQGIYADAPVTLSNAATGTIDGANFGIILFRNGNLVTNDGLITGNEGIRSNGSVTLTNNLGGVVGGSNAAFHLAGSGAGSITNYGDFTNGVVSTGGGNLTVDNRASGNIVRVPFGSAIDMSNGGKLTLTNAGDIVGSGWGVVGRNAGDSIVNSGRIASGTISGETITAGGANAIELQQGGTVTNLTGGQIIGGSSGIAGSGIVVDNRAGASVSGRFAVSIANGGRVTNAGIISGGTANGNIGVQLNNNGSLTNLAGGTINGARATQFSGANAVLTNAGTIASNATTPSQGYGAFFINGGTANNLAGGTITGSYRGVSIQGGVGTITNAGTIRSTTDVAAVLFNGGTITNQAGGLIDGHYRGAIIAGAPGTVTNSGTISAVVDNAVSLFNGGTVTNNASGSIVANGAGGWGIYGTGGPINISNAGSIHADSGIVTNANGAVVTNSGAVTGAVDGVMSYGASTQSLTNSGTIAGTNGHGVEAGGALTLNNQAGGTIRGGNSGLFLYAGGTVANSGSIASLGVAGSNQDGISAFGALNLTNSGSITAAVNAGVVAFDSLLTVDNQAGGTIAGGNSIYGFAINAKAGLDLTNGGTLNAGSGTTTAVLVAGPSTINLLAGSTTNGNIVSTGSATSALTVAGQLNGRYDATAGTAIDTVVLASSGTIGGALLGGGDDSFTTRGGTIGGTVDGGAGNDVLTFDIAGSASYDAGLFAGFESRSKTGAGTLTLTGTDGLTADFALNGGTLVLSGGAALNDAAALVTAAGTTTRLANANEQVRTISGAGAIDLGAYALILGGNDSSTYSGVISGTGSLAKFGTGILTLSGANAYTGLTQVSAGTLRLGASNVIADASIVLVASGATFDLAGFDETIGGLTGAGNVTLGAGRLTVNQSANTLFSGPITGTGGLTKAGSGTLNLTGASTYGGATFVNGGTLAVNGSLVSAVTVNSGGTLGGNGSVGATSILSGGILAPGNSIGHLTVNGNLSFAAGSIYQVETTPTASDSTSVTGNIAIAGGTVQVLATGAPYNPLTRYTILDSVGTVSGAFANVTSNLAFLTPGLEYNPKSVVLVLRRNNIIFSAVAANPNQVAVANAVQSIGISPLYDAVLVQSAAGARQAYDALSGEVYASTETALLAQRDRLQDAMASNRLRTDGMSLWLDAGKSWGTFDFSPRGAAAASTNTDDLLGGFNWTRGSLGFTVAGGRVIDKVEIEDRSSRAKAKSWLFGGQLAYGADLGLHAVAGGNYASHKVSTDRSIAFPGFADTASSNRSGSGYHLFGQLGYASQTAGIVLEPFVGLARDHLKLDAVSETGGLAALDVRAASRNLTTTQLGLKLASTANLGWAVFTPRASIAWQHVMGDRTGQMKAGFQAGGLDYAVTGASLARDSAKVGVDLDFNLGGATVVAGYTGTLAGVASDHTAKVAVQVRF